MSRATPQARAALLGLLAGALIVGAPVAMPAAAADARTGGTGRAPHAEAALLGPGEVYGNIPPRDEHGRDQLAMFREWNPDPVGRHRASLDAVSPALARVIRKVEADEPGLRFVIGSGLRSDALQRKALAWGWSATPVSAHQSGLAVDLWPLDAQGRVLFDATLQNRIAAAMKRAAAALGVGIRWGGTFRGYKRRDRSHFELVTTAASRS